MSNLEILDISKNKIRKLPKEFGNLMSLKVRHWVIIFEKLPLFENINIQRLFHKGPKDIQKSIKETTSIYWRNEELTMVARG